MPIEKTLEPRPRKERPGCSRCGFKPLTQRASLESGICRACVWERRPDWGRRSADEYGAFRLGLLLRIDAEKLTPRAVSHLLADSGFKEIQSEEIARLYRTDDVWTPDGFKSPEAREEWRAAVREGRALSGERGLSGETGQAELPDDIEAARLDF